MEPLAHASVGLIAKRFAPKAPLWALVVATQVPDIVGLTLIAAGIERGAVTKLDLRHGLQYLNLSQASIPWSHGVAVSVLWSAVITAAAILFLRDRKAGIAVGLAALSHPALDAIVYLGIPIFFDNSHTTGLGLITSGPGLIAGIAMEIGLITGGIASCLALRKRKTVLASG